MNTSIVIAYALSRDGSHLDVEEALSSFSPLLRLSAAAELRMKADKGLLGIVKGSLDGYARIDCQGLEDAFELIGEMRYAGFFENLPSVAKLHAFVGQGPAAFLKTGGEAACEALMLLKRKAGMGFEEFCRYHEHIHAPLFCAVPSVRTLVTDYRAIYSARRELLDGEGIFDGAVFIGLPTPKDLVSVFTDRAYLSGVRYDESRMLNRRACELVLSSRRSTLV
jgi:hypothetical protein